MKPEALINLASNLQSMPGISKKQAERIAYFLVQSNNQIGEDLSNAINEANLKIKKCKICNHLTEEGICYICKDKTRVKIVVVVESPLDVFKFEEANKLKAKYYVLGGLINISKKIEFEDLQIQGLKERVKGSKEVILALSPTLEGIVTANYLKALLKGNKVTQLAQGIPLGAAMEYVDELTLKAALDNRKEVE